MEITPANLRGLRTAYNLAFTAGLGRAPSLYSQIATTVPSTTGTEDYPWLGELPGLRKWAGSRVVHGLTESGYSITNEPFELTVGVKRARIEDDQYGIYTPMMEHMGQSAAEHPDELVFGLLKDGRSQLCYDKQAFFSAGHPVLNASGKTVSQSNMDDSGGGSNYWYLLDTRRTLKPIIFQNRKSPQFVAKTDLTDENVFDRDEFVFGVDARRNVGFGFWQLAQSSNKTLNADNLKTNITAMTSRKGDYDRPLGINPNLLVVGPSQEFAAAKLVSNALTENGGTNELAGRVQVLVVPWL